LLLRVGKRRKLGRKKTEKDRERRGVGEKTLK
jgi:hypothetical protein